jgi:hypothetical protein
MDALVQQHDAVMSLVKENQELKAFKNAALERIKALDEQIAQCSCAVIGAEGEA